MSSAAPATVVSASCAICQENFDEASETSATRCGHCFHTRCLGEWLKQSKTCPQCRHQVGNPHEVLRVFLSFGSPGDNLADGDEPSGLADLRHRLAAMTEEASVTKKKLKRIERLDAHRRRDLSQRQQRLETCQAENSQLMQLLEQEHTTHETQVQDERRRRREAEARSQEFEESSCRLLAENVQLCQSLATLQQEVAHLDDCLQQERAASVKLTDQLLAAEAESFALTKRLAVGHARDSMLADRLQKSEVRVRNLSERLLRLGTRASATSQEEISPLIDVGSGFGSLPDFLTGRLASNTAKTASLSAEI